MPIIFLYLILSLLLAQDAKVHASHFEAFLALAVLTTTLVAGRSVIREWLRG